MHRFTALATAVLSLAAAAPAIAASSASASISDFTVTLFDLNPTDGVTPSISYFPSPYGSYVSSSANDSASGSQSGTGFSFLPFGPASSTSTAGLATATGVVSGNAGTSLLISSSGSAGGASLPGFGSSFSAEALGGYYSFSFELSPFTLVVFGGTANLLAQTTVGAEAAPDFSFFNTENASAGVGLSVFGPAAGGGGGSQSSNDGRNVFASYEQVFNPNTGGFDFVGQTQAISGVALAGSFTNFSSGALQGQLTVSTNVNGFSSVTAIPEPGTWALMLAGMLAVGAVARRRQR